MAEIDGLDGNYQKLQNAEGRYLPAKLRLESDDRLLKERLNLMRGYDIFNEQLKTHELFSPDYDSCLNAVSLIQERGEAVNAELKSRMKKLLGIPQKILRIDEREKSLSKLEQAMNLDDATITKSRMVDVCLRQPRGANGMLKLKDSDRLSHYFHWFEVRFGILDLICQIYQETLPLEQKRYARLHPNYVKSRDFINAAAGRIDDAFAVEEAKDGI